MVTALGLTIGELIYFFGAADTVFFAWLFIIVAVFQVFAVIALYVAQAKRGDIFTFIGFVLLIIGLLFSLINSAGQMAITTGLLTEVQLDPTQQISSFVALGKIDDWAFISGAILFGYGTFRTGIFPRWAGILLLLLGVASIFRDITVVEYIWAALSLAAWGWLGWALWANPGAPES